MNEEVKALDGYPSDCNRNGRDHDLEINICAHKNLKNSQRVLNYNKKNPPLGTAAKLSQRPHSRA
eukprot:1391770-Amorphochlora_amoeboformis.AAC.3